MDVTVGFRYSAAEHFVEEPESLQMVIQHFEVAGHWLPADIAQLRNLGPFLQLEIRTAVTDEDTSPSTLRGLGEALALRDEVEPHEYVAFVSLGDELDYREQTTDELLVLPVSSLEWIEMRDRVCGCDG